jgi:hypothetical protein
MIVADFRLLIKLLENYRKVGKYAEKIQKVEEILFLVAFC